MKKLLMLVFILVDITCWAQSESNVISMFQHGAGIKFSTPGVFYTHFLFSPGYSLGIKNHFFSTGPSFSQRLYRITADKGFLFWSWGRSGSGPANAKMGTEWVLAGGYLSYSYHFHVKRELMLYYDYTFSNVRFTDKYFSREMVVNGDIIQDIPELIFIDNVFSLGFQFGIPKFLMGIQIGLLIRYTKEYFDFEWEKGIFPIPVPCLSYCISYYFVN